MRKKKREGEGERERERRGAKTEEERRRTKLTLFFSPSSSRFLFLPPPPPKKNVNSGLKSLRARLVAAVDYCDAVAAGRLPANHDILRLLQDAFNALPSAPPSGASPDPALARALSARANDMMLAAYMGSLVRAVLALHGLVDNRETAAARRREAARKEEEERNPRKKGDVVKAEGGEKAAEEGTADGKKK